MKTGFVAFLGTAAVATVANADFVGWTANVRNATGGGFLVNVFACTNSSTDALLNVYGGTPGTPNAGFITTTSAGGFRQSGSQPTFKPGVNQNWTTLDSFLTIGGGFVTGSNNWQGNSSTVGDVPWEYELDGSTLDGFSTAPSPDEGITNPYVNSIPATGGWYAGPAGSPARSLASLTNRVSSSGTAAQNATFGVMVAQFYLTEANVTMKMGATMKRADGTTSQNTFTLYVPIPAPGAIALLGVAGLVTAPGRRRA